ncbi:helix-turn-helix domain-containing protein [Actinoalloteichus caeruleus]|uniref:Helix-turn-helix domain-containing protein n=1 Tax=Actinoalloteichus caeruleus DSM 43889 TaxID=1120930 RepID=A0ABT1JFZ2_ACTCY|nr:helix-turn-helix transcriptional regulator [Actinoalloteichus caeruleus]MCP2331401.1 Helix-turn-helix domain-containing protein [Actinoalloteichus caeruleus DSM 43889]
MRNNPPPLAYRLLLGQALRAHRERAGLEPNDVAKALGWYQRKVGFVESGHRKIAMAEAERLSELFQLSPAERERVLNLASEARRRDMVTPPVAGWALEYVAVEAAATQVRVFQEELIPGFIQTASYARAILSTALVPARDGVEAAVTARLTRQQRITGPDAPNVHLLLGEAALRRLVGGPKVMREQLRTLSEFAEADHVTLQVLPFVAGEYAALGTSFMLLDVGEPCATFALTETLVDGEWYDGPPYLERFTAAFERVASASLDVEDSHALLLQVRDEIKE